MHFHPPAMSHQSDHVSQPVLISVQEGPLNGQCCQVRHAMKHLSQLRNACNANNQMKRVKSPPPAACWLQCALNVQSYNNSQIKESTSCATTALECRIWQLVTPYPSLHHLIKCPAPDCDPNSCSTHWTVAAAFEANLSCNTHTKCTSL